PLDRDHLATVLLGIVGQTGHRAPGLKFSSVQPFAVERLVRRDPRWRDWLSQQVSAERRKANFSVDLHWRYHALVRRSRAFWHRAGWLCFAPRAQVPTRARITWHC